jgi:hypothetical protein
MPAIVVARTVRRAIPGISALILVLVHEVEAVTAARVVVTGANAALVTFVVGGVVGHLWSAWCLTPLRCGECQCRRCKRQGANQSEMTDCHESCLRRQFVQDQGQARDDCISEQSVWKH